MRKFHLGTKYVMLIFCTSLAYGNMCVTWVIIIDVVVITILPSIAECNGWNHLWILIPILLYKIIIYKFLQLKFHNNTLQNLSHDVQISRGEMTLSRVLARQNDGDTNNDKLVLCHCCVANWTKPRAWFCGLSLGLAEVFTPKFCYLSRRGELSRYQVWTIGLHDKWTSAQLFCRFPWTLFGVCFDVRPN